MRGSAVQLNISGPIVAVGTEIAVGAEIAADFFTFCLDYIFETSV